MPVYMNVSFAILLPTSVTSVKNTNPNPNPNSNLCNSVVETLTNLHRASHVLQHPLADLVLLLVRGVALVLFLKLVHLPGGGGGGIDGRRF